MTGKRICTPVSEEEKKLARECQTIGEFSEKYVAMFGNRVGVYALPKRVTNVWGIYHFAKPVKKTQDRNNFPETGELLVKIHNLLAESLQIQKEQIELFKSLKKVA